MAKKLKHNVLINFLSNLKTGMRYKEMQFSSIELLQREKGLRHDLQVVWISLETWEYISLELKSSEYDPFERVDPCLTKDG